ncbi:MAG: hypothetical protein RIE52_03765 [Balneola sp.]|jgi:hypothetical protein
MNVIDQKVLSKDIALNNLKLRGATWNLYAMNFVLFFTLKIWFRPWIREQEGFEYLKLIANSFPNYVEAYLGTFTIVAFLTIAKLKNISWIKDLSNITIYTLSTIFTGLFVITQEMKIHNLGGENIYDFNDVIASIIGLIIVFTMLNLYGIKLIKK